ncbi:MAG: beta-hydroxyacyl-ACP dehydratase [Planctomycetes bacterium]|nr:beta-hydroxyacyl-ACP dehydratase [Planctomycetota bacterium]
MAAKPLLDLTKFSTDRILIDREGINKVNPQRFEFQQLDGIYYVDLDIGEAAGLREVKDDEFWVRGHIPGRPLLPGVLMIEAAAQLVSYIAMSRHPERGFMGFGGVNDVKFRGTVVPGQKILMFAKELEMRTRRCVGATQGFVDGKLVFEGTITGMWL